MIRDARVIQPEFVLHEVRHRDGEVDAIEAALNPATRGEPAEIPFLDGVDVHTADSLMPDGIIWSLLDRVELPTHLRIVAPVITLSIAEAVYDRVSASGPYILDVIVPHAVVERADDPFLAWATRMRNDANVHLSRASIPFSFGLWIADTDQAGIAVVTDQGGVHDLLSNDSERAIAWATELYERVHHDAEPVGSKANTTSQVPSPPDARVKDG